MTYPEQAFWKRVNKHGPVHPVIQTECWIWVGSIASDKRYGRFGRWSAHRLGWLVQNGEIPDRLLVCHKCDNTRCVRGDHLFLGTYSDNMRDCSNKSRINRGVKRKLSKLTETNVLEIRSLRNSGLSLGMICMKFPVTQKVIGDICNNKIWKHVQYVGETT